MGSEARRSPIAIACRLTDEEQRHRREVLSRELFSSPEDIRELDDGYEFVFAGGAEWAENLVSFVVSERECCPLFPFTILFEPAGGPVSPRVRSPEWAREFVREVFVDG